MEITRLIELSLYYSIKKHLSISKTKEILKNESTDFTIYNLKYSNIETEYGVEVYVNDVPYQGEYTVDYINGVVKFLTPLLSTDIVKATYHYCPVNIYDEGTQPTTENFRYPALSIYEDETISVGYELGSVKKERRASWIVEIWAERGGERNDITDKVYRLFEENNIPLIDYNISFPTNSDGTINNSFDKLNQTIGYISVESINYDKGGSLQQGDKPKYVSHIFVDLVINN